MVVGAVTEEGAAGSVLVEAVGGTVKVRTLVGGGGKADVVWNKED